MVPKIRDTAADALSLVTDAFRNADKFQGLLSSVSSSIQTLEDELDKVHAERWLAWAPGLVNGTTPIVDAVGEALDTLGALVGELRMGRADAPYAEAIRTRVVANLSGGTPNDLQNIAKILIASIQQSFAYYTEDSQTFQLQIFPSETGRYISQLLSGAKPAGVSGDFIFLNFLPSILLEDVLAWDHTSAILNPDFGSWGHIGDPNDSGVWADTTRI